MKKINTTKWGDFKISDIFNVIKGTRLTKANMEDGDIRFVGSSALNNGETHRIGNTEHLHPANTITVCYNGSVGETFYQNERFWASDDVNVLYPKFEMNEFVAMFICPIIKTVGKKYAFIDKWKQDDMKEEPIKLPVDKDGVPDWLYMENYMRTIMDESVEFIERLRRADKGKRKIDTKEWGEFKITELFDLSLPKGDIQVKKVEDGDVPLITPSAVNNGLIQKIDIKSESTLYKAGSLTVDMFGNAYYQPEDFFVTAHGHVNVLLPQNFTLNEYTGAFVSSAIHSMFFGKYGFSDMCTQKVLKEEKISLPVTMKLEPDWQYMESYMQNLMQDAEANIEALTTVF